MILAIYLHRCVVTLHHRGSRMKLVNIAWHLIEAQFDIKRRKEGEVQFPTSSLTDQHVKDLIDIIAKNAQVPSQEVEQYIQSKIDAFGDMSQKSPLLYETMVKNAAESEAFTLFWEAGHRVPGAPEFSNVVFRKLIQKLRIEYDEFFPLRSYIDRRNLVAPVIEVVKNEDGIVPTASATPNGTFYFNQEFMQALIDYSYLKGIKPKGQKFKANGGSIPDEYAWIEFLIMHEFMHYSNDDFYYQKIIPNADPQIINWVGDFRTNYLLTKSGFEALPTGLFNDKINYDRQSEYIEMYNLVKEEFDKIPKEDQDELRKAMNERTDDHTEGNKQGEESDVTSDDANPGDLDDHAKTNEDKVDDGEQGKSKGKSKQGVKGEGEGSEEKGKGSGKPGGAGKNPDKYKVDVSKIQPRFNWKTIVDRFIKSGLSHTEETYAKPHRRTVTSMDIVRQVGAAAIKPAEVPVEQSDAKLMVIIDNSGSMSSVIEIVVANMKVLFKTPMFRRATIIAMKFSGEAELWKVNIAQNKAGKIDQPKDQPKDWNVTADAVLDTSMGGGTYISTGMVARAKAAFAAKYNVILFSDSDVLHGENYTNLLQMFKAAPSQMFIVFDSQRTYAEFRRMSGIASDNISYFIG